VGIHIPPPLAFNTDADADPGWPDEELVPHPEEAVYPLRADAGAEPSEEIEAYTRILGAPAEGDPSGEAAE
jgi:hypothetical protein